MIPISLTLQGIYSYQTRQSIDFTKLTGAGIFGIFGPVGGGKSTIIEAITYALYGRTDRLNLSGDNRNYNMMNLKSNEMLIEFIFRAGDDRSEYMAVVKSRRNSRQFEDVKAIDRTAYKKIQNEWVPVEMNVIEKAVGMSYDNFKRTVIIPQGKFQEFLLLGSKERTQMMKELFSLERYELYYKVVSLESKTTQQKQNIEGHLQQLGNITPQLIATVENSYNEILKEIKLKIEELSIKQNEESLQRQLMELVSKAKQYQSQLDALKLREPEISLLEKRIASYEYVLLNFKGLLNSFHLGKLKTEQLRAIIENDSLRLNEIVLQISNLESEFEEIKRRYESRESLKQEADEIMKISRVFELQKQNHLLKERIDQGEKVVADTVKLVEALKDEQENVFSDLKQLKDQYPDMNRLSKAKEWFTVQKLIVVSGTEIEAECAAVQKDMGDIAQIRALLFNSDCFAGIPLSESYDKVVADLDEKKRNHNNIIEILNQEKQHYQVQQKLQEYASGLDDGQPCPLCGSLEHPRRFNSENIAETLANVNKELSNHEKSVVSIENGLKKLTELNTSLCLKEELLNKLSKRKDDYQQKLTAHQDTFSWNEFKAESEVNSLFVAAEKLTAAITEKEKKLEDLRLRIDKEVKQKEKFSKAIDEFKSIAIQAFTEASTLTDQLKILQISGYEGYTPEILTEKKNSLLSQYAEVELNYQTSVNKINLLKKEQDMLSGSLSANNKALEKEVEAFRQLEKNIEDKLEVSSYSSLDEVNQSLAWNLDLEKEREKVSVFRRDFDFTQKQLLILKEEIGSQQFDEAAYKNLKLAIETISEEINTKNQNKGHLESELKKLRDDLEMRNKLLLVFSSLELRLEDIKTLKQLFKGSGFVNYISSVYLHELAQSANERFYKLSGQKLSLELTSDNNFEVRDFMNGGKCRNVKTLSGGQTFQAALSLALALSDNTRKLSGPDENFFFLDEGFGSLDKESLGVVFETLKSLRHENRIVGVISHVEEMNQEIDVHLKVKNYEDKGSIIEKSWEMA